MLFTSITMNPAWLHLDFDYAANESEFGQPLVNSMLTLAMVIGISVHETTLGTTVANLGFTEVSFPAPMFHGDTLHVETEVKDARPSRVAPGPGRRRVRTPRLQSARRSVLQSRPLGAHAQRTH